METKRRRVEEKRGEIIVKKKRLEELNQGMGKLLAGREEVLLLRLLLIFLLLFPFILVLVLFLVLEPYPFPRPRP